MKSKSLILLFVIFFTSQSVFAGLLDVKVKNSKSKTQEKQEQQNMGVSNDAVNGLKTSPGALVAPIEDFINTLMLTTVTFFNGKLNVSNSYEQGFIDTATNPSSKTISYTITNSSGVSKTNSFTVNGRSWTVFKLFVLIWLIAACFYFCYKRVADPQFQVREIPILLYRIVIIMLLFWVTPKLADFFVNFMWWAAECVTVGVPDPSVSTGVYKGSHMTYSYLLTNAINMRDAASLIATMGATTAASFIHATFWGVGASFEPLGNVAVIGFGMLFAALAVSLIVSLMYCTWILELYLGSWVLIVFLPSCLFNGFGYKEISVLKFYFANALEIFMGAVLIFLFSDIFQNVNITGSSWILKPLNLLVKPTLLLILFPAVSKICNAILQGGSGLADTSRAATEAGKTVAGYMTTGVAAYNKMPSASGSGNGGSGNTGITSRMNQMQNQLDNLQANYKNDKLG